MADRSFSDKEKEAIYLSQNKGCGDCGLVLNGYWHIGGYFNKPKQTFTINNAQIHHIIPMLINGKHNIDNWVLLCNKCHNKRHTNLYRSGIMKLSFNPNVTNNEVMEFLLGVNYGRTSNT